MSGSYTIPSYSITNSPYNVGIASAIVSNASNGNGLDVKGDIILDGVSLKDTIQKISDRLAILTPDLEKLEHFSALKKAYENYKMLEKLCELPSKENDNI